MSRAERLRAVSEDWRAWARTATTDEPPTAVIASVVPAILAGDLPGHEFHGNQWTQHAVTSETMNVGKIKALMSELDAQGVPKDHPIRGVIDHYGSTVAVSRKGGEITGAVAYDLGTKRGMSDTTNVHDLRSMERGGGAGTALMAQAARDTLASSGRNEMSISNAVGNALPFYARIGAQPRFGGVTDAHDRGGFRIDGQVSQEQLLTDTHIRWSPHWDEAATRKLAGEGAVTAAGDLPGHPFRGNQYTGGQGSSPKSDQWHDAYEAIKEPDGGFTLNADGTPVTRGIPVPISGYESRHPVYADEAEAKAHFSEYLEGMRRDEVSDEIKVGGWHDPDTHEVALDRNEIFTPERDGADWEAKAVAAGTERGENSLINLETGEFYRLGGKGSGGAKLAGTVADGQATGTPRDDGSASRQVVEGPDRRGHRRDVDGGSQAGHGQAAEVLARIAGLAASVIPAKLGGDLAGHPFRGNQWTGGHGDGDAPKVELGHDVPFVAADLAAPREASTLVQHIKDGKLDPERAKIHDDIVRQALQGATPVEHPEFVFIGGGPATGKSTARNMGVFDTDPNSIVVENDNLKAMLPEGDAAHREADPRGWAPLVHAEAGHLTERTIVAAVANRYNVVLDGVGNSKLADVEAKVDEARAAGYRIRGEYLTIPTEVAVQRAEERVQKEGRAVPMDQILGKHAGVSAVWPELIKAKTFDELNLYDASGPPGERRLVASAADGELTVHEPKIYAEFLAKADAVK